jgi:hypothetical protein
MSEQSVGQKTHDYTQRTWGHDYTVLSVIENGQRLRLSGWGFGIRTGDYLILPNGSATTRYHVDSIDYRMDPRDMWFAEATFAPRQAVFDA